MSHGQPKWAAAKTARKRNLLWTMPAVFFFVLGVGFLAVFAINYVDALLQGGHYLALIISGNASAFLTLSVFSLLLGGIFKVCGYLAALSYVKLNEQLVPSRPAAREAEELPPAPAKETESSAAAAKPDVFDAAPAPPADL